MTDRVAIATARLQTEEGKKPRAYNDATGETVSCRPGGNLSIGFGINLETGLDDYEMDFLLQHRVSVTDKALRAYLWYTGVDEIRGSVLLDVGFNSGISGLLHFPKMLAAAGDHDWPTMSHECAVANPKLDASRYAPLRQIILSGVV